jgi:exosortase A
MEAPFVADIATTERAIAIATPSGWPLAAAVVGIAMVWVAAWYWDTARAMTETWQNSTTYTHGFLVVPISAWLIWRERVRLARLRPHHDLRVLPLLAAPGAAWLLANLAGVRVVEQFALVLMIVVLVWALLGPMVARALAFPLLFLLFAVPVGDFLLPALMEYTAQFTVLALHATGVPVYREGMSITVPSGNWSVVEAGSGLRYLIACVTGGVLFAYLRYRSLGRRLVFIAAAVVVPVVANWLRAYVIVMISEVSGGKIAAGVDHLLYGWIFFAMVTLLLFGIASVWREDSQSNDAAQVVPASHGGRAPTPSRWLSAALATSAAIAVWPAAAWHLEGGPAKPPSALAVPDAGEWRIEPARITDWTPHFAAPSVVQQTYAKGADRVALYIAYYRDQRRGAELVSSMNTLAASEDAWRVTEEFLRPVVVAGEDLVPIESHLRRQPTRLVAWRWYWVDGTRTTSPYRAKLLQLRSQLRGRGDDAAVVVIYTGVDQQSSEGAAVLHDFAAAALPQITQVLDDARLR